jgi:hypothetical protein
MLAGVDERQHALLNELPAINVHPARKVLPVLPKITLWLMQYIFRLTLDLGHQVCWPTRHHLRPED